MIILKVLLYVLLAVLGIAGVVLILASCLPAAAEVSFIDGRFTYKVNYSFLKLLDSDGKGFLKRRKKKKKSKPENFSESEDRADDSGEDDYMDFPEDDIDIDMDADFPENDSDEDVETEISGEPDENNMRSEKIRRIKEKKSGKSEEVFDEPDKEKSGSSKTVSDKIDFLIDIWDIAGRPLLKVFKGFHLKNVYIDFIVADEDAYKCALVYGTVCNTVYNSLAWLGELFTVSYETVDIRCGFSLKKSQWDASCKVSFRLYHLAIAGVWFAATYFFRIFIPKKRKNKK